MEVFAEVTVCPVIVGVSLDSVGAAAIGKVS